MAQGREAPPESTTASYAMPAEMYVSSELNSRYDNLFISKYREQELESGQQIPVVLKLRTVQGGSTLTEIARSNPENIRQSLMNYAQNMERALEATIDQIAAIDGVQVISKGLLTPIVTVVASMDGLTKLLAMNDIVDIQENGLAEKHLDGTNAIIGADVVKAEGCDGGGCSVAVLDTGTDENHIMFSGGKIVGSACFNSTVAGTSTTTCPNGTDFQAGPGGAAGTPCPLPSDFHLTFVRNLACGIHGNSVASIAAGNSYFGNFEGVASGASLVPINVFSFFPSFGNQLLSWGSDQYAALEWVALNARAYNICAVNMSLGGGRSFAPCDSDFREPIITFLRAMGIATVISSGNSGYSDSVGFPGCISSAITVGATDNGDNLAGFSNHDDQLVDLLAPGVSVSSAYGYQDVLGFQWWSSGWSGTSMAAPHVAGAFAILKARYPHLSVTEIEDALKATGVPVAHPVTGEVVPRIQIDAAKALVASIAVPTIGTWGILILGLVLGIFGIRAIQSRVTKPRIVK